MNQGKKYTYQNLWCEEWVELLLNVPCSCAGIPCLSHHKLNCLWHLCLSFAEFSVTPVRFMTPARAMMLQDANKVTQKGNFIIESDSQK